MKFGVFLPISGRATGPDTLMEAASSAEALGFDAVWSADRVVTPWQINTSYPYSENHEFIVPPDRPFLDSLTCLAFLAGCTEKITLGISVLVLPYRHPLYWTRVAASIERQFSSLASQFGLVVKAFMHTGVQPDTEMPGFPISLKSLPGN